MLEIRIGSPQGDLHADPMGRRIILASGCSLQYLRFHVVVLLAICTCLFFIVWGRVVGSACNEHLLIFSICMYVC